MPSTIDETKELWERVNEKSHSGALCLDVGHGYYRSSDPRDLDYYSWLQDLSPSIHMQQTDRRSRHWTLLEENNAQGVIVPERVLRPLKLQVLKK